MLALVRLRASAPHDTATAARVFALTVSSPRPTARADGGFNDGGDAVVAGTRGSDVNTVQPHVPPAKTMNRKTPTGRWAFVLRSSSSSAQAMISETGVDDAVSPVPMLARVEPMACRMVMRTSAVFLRTSEGPRRWMPGKLMAPPARPARTIG